MRWHHGVIIDTTICTAHHTILISSKRATATGMSGENRLRRVVTLPLDWELKQPSAYKITLSRALRTLAKMPARWEGGSQGEKAFVMSLVLRRTSMPLIDLPLGS